MAGPSRRARALLPAALVMALALAPGAVSAAPPQEPPQQPPQQPIGPSSAGADGADAAALQDLLAETGTDRVEVRRDPTGAVTSVDSATGGAVLDTAAADPRPAVRQLVAEHGEVFGLDGDGSRAVVGRARPTLTGGTVVRSAQLVDGLPVLGGELVTVLDAEADIVSVTAATSRAADLPEPRVGPSQAAETALAAVAAARSVAPGSLSAQVDRLWHLDPALLGLTDRRGPRPAWGVTVGDGAAVRETVLVGATDGEVALRFDALPGARQRWVCDNAGAATVASQPERAVPVCVDPSVREGHEDPRPEPEPEPEPVPEPEPDPDRPEDPEQLVPASSEEARAAYRHLGVADDLFTQLRGSDAPSLTELVGADVGGTRRLTATVDWCFAERCPYPNAFWDSLSRQAVLGNGFAAADDIVVHEVAHGFVEATSGLFYFQQSGALNESLADVLGEIADQRHTDPGRAEDPQQEAAWLVGEDVTAPGWRPRSLRDPGSTGQPDRMGSPRWRVASWDVDGGAKHHNAGVGNKTAYLVSQGTGKEPGKSFNGATFAGIDAGDPSLRRTGALYLEVIQRLPSAAQYADLGRILVGTCDELRTNGTSIAGVSFTKTHCTSVRAAVAATELEQPTAAPGGMLGEAPRSCPTGTQRLLARDDDGLQDFRFTFTDGLWERAGVEARQPGQQSGSPSYARSGRQSLLGHNPDPLQYGDPEVSEAVSTELAVPRTTGGVFLHFHHAFALESLGTRHLDGATVQVRPRDGSQRSLPDSAWVNGPRQRVKDRPGLWFAGDSQGWGSSRLDLSAYAGQAVRVVLRIEADEAGSAYGWWLDDLRLYACEGPAASAPRDVVATAGSGSAAVSWQPPASGAEPAGYLVTRSDRSGPTGAVDLPATARDVVLPDMPTDRHVTVSVRAVAAGGLEGAVTAQQLWASATTLGAPARTRPNRPFKVTTRVVRRGSSVGLGGVPVQLERWTGRSWVRVASGTTATNGTRAWTVRQRPTTTYRVRASALGPSFPSTSPQRVVRRR